MNRNVFIGLVIFLGVAEVRADVYEDADAHFERQELLTLRTNPSSVDQCMIDERQGSGNFASQLQAMIEVGMNSHHSFLEHIVIPYNLRPQRSMVSLQSHELCAVDRQTLARTLKFAHRVPSDETIERINRFAGIHNQLRTRGDTRGMSEHWGKLFACLAYVESLLSPDPESAFALAREYGPDGYEKPLGVSFHMDRSANNGSRYLTVGLFQFHQNVRGNILSCVQRWNSLVEDQCKIPERGSDEATLPVLASPYQSFNAFCGVDKIVQSFYVQVNTSNSLRTHPHNQGDQGLKHPSERCVSPHFYANYAYNHYGPLQNTVGANLDKVMACVMP